MPNITVVSLHSWAEISQVIQLSQIIDQRRAAFDSFTAKGLETGTLLKDEWDVTAHHVCGVDRKMHVGASIRISFAKNGVLPFSELYQYPVTEHDVEIGRTVVSSPYKAGVTAMALFLSCVRLIEKGIYHPDGTLYVDPLLKSDSNLPNYLTDAGFSIRTDCRTDHRYGLLSRAYGIKLSDLSQIFDWRDRTFGDRLEKSALLAI